MTIDAMGCQTAIAAQITAGGGDYVLAVKDNQPHLAEALRDFFATLNAPGHCRRQVSLHETLDKGHGRIETRRCTAVGELDWLDLLGLKARWSRLVSVACSLLRRLGLNLFRADKSRAISLPRKLKTTAYNPAHLATALHLKKI